MPLQSSFAIAVFFAFISGAPYFMLDVLHRPATEYGLYFILVSAGFMAGNLLAARITARVGLDRMILIGSALALAATLLALALLAARPWVPIALFGPMLGAAFANGLTVPNAQAGAISVDPLLAGSASGLAGFLQMFTAALVSQAVGALQNGTPYPMIAFMTACALLSLAGFVLPPRRATRSAQSTSLSRAKLGRDHGEKSPQRRRGRGDQKSGASFSTARTSLRPRRLCGETILPTDPLGETHRQGARATAGRSRTLHIFLCNAKVSAPKLGPRQQESHAMTSAIAPKAVPCPAHGRARRPRTRATTKRT